MKVADQLEQREALRFLDDGIWELGPINESVKDPKSRHAVMRLLRAKISLLVEMGESHLAEKSLLAFLDHQKKMGHPDPERALAAHLYRVKIAESWIETGDLSRAELVLAPFVAALEGLDGEKIKPYWDNDRGWLKRKNFERAARVLLIIGKKNEAMHVLSLTKTHSVPFDALSPIELYLAIEDLESVRIILAECKSFADNARDVGGREYRKDRFISKRILMDLAMGDLESAEEGLHKISKPLERRGSAHAIKAYEAGQFQEYLLGIYSLGPKAEE